MLQLICLCKRDLTSDKTKLYAAIKVVIIVVIVLVKLITSAPCAALIARNIAFFVQVIRAIRAAILPFYLKHINFSSVLFCCAKRYAERI